MVPVPRGGGGAIAGAALISAATLSSSSNSWSDYPYSHGPITPIISSTVTKILDRCSLTSISGVSDSNAASRLHCLAALSEAAINEHYKMRLFAQPFTKKAVWTIFLIVSVGGFALIALFAFGRFCAERCCEGRAKKRGQEIALARARFNKRNTWGR